MNELVSIVIPVYNAERYLDAAISSCLEQTYSKIEIVSVYGDSTDNSFEILKNYEDKIMVKPQDNKGVSAAINTGIRSMNGKLFKIMNADDVLYPDAVDLLVSEFIKVKNKKTIIHGDGVILDSNDNFVREFQHSDLSHLSQFEQNVILLNNNMVTNTTTLFHADTFAQCGLYDESVKAPEDYEFWLRLCIQFNYHLHLLPEKIVKYREHEESMTAKSLQNTPNYAEEVRELVLNRLDSATRNKYEKALKQYQKKYQVTLRKKPKQLIKKIIRRMF